MNKEQHLVLTLIVIIALMAAVIRLRTTGFWIALTTKQPNPEVKIGTPIGPITLFGTPDKVAAKK